ncbi:hypothetical protein DCAR_0313436 [Daucus carota subsp. sativus]|uniref:Uncharacterized protein n=1 Tax=Daucus carota subsp. sativus TaxID=79200 RepID=A0AAF0WTD6_DAUCS|nr:hypothetical protein DCAR_0313436 [Daucus carota subsp. sativus]
MFAWVKGSAWIPVLDVESTFNVGTLPKKVTNFMMGGWWSGVPTLSYNTYSVLSEAESKFSKDKDLILAYIYNAGYRNLFWFAGIGGLPEFLGLWHIEMYIDVFLATNIHNYGLSTYESFYVHISL